MLNNEMLIKRLALIKYLYSIGLEQSHQVETLASFSILSFQDSIEMFLKLIAEHKNIKSEKFNFLDYWIHIPELTLLESMRNLNARRVNIKHKGLLPSKSDIEISRVNTTDFFEQNVFTQCGVDFKEISLLSLISYENVRLLLVEAQNAQNEDKSESCVEKAAIAFDELLYTYEESKIDIFSYSHFYFGSEDRLNSSSSMGIKEKKMSEFIDNVKSSINVIQKAIKIISFGIDYKRYVKFKILTPLVTRMVNGEYFAEIYGEKKWTKENCQFCIDFVLECALKLQEFDFDIKEMEDYKRFTQFFDFNRKEE